MQKIPKYNPIFPPEDPEVSMELGQFMLRWGTLEQQLDSSISGLLGIDPTLGLCIAANLGTKAKLDILNSLIGMYADALEEKLVIDARHILTRISDLSSLYRNTVAHGQPTNFPYLDRDNWILGRYSARKTVSLSVYELSPKKWATVTKSVMYSTRRWCSAFQKICRIISNLTPDELDELYSFQAKLAQPKISSHPRHRLRAIDKSKAQKAKRGRQKPPPRSSPA